MIVQDGAPLVVVAAGGTGGHLFPAAALSAELARRGVDVALATDRRAAQYGETFPADAVHVIPSATLRARNPLAVARTVVLLGAGIVAAWRLLRRLKPRAVVGFGGYPTVPPLLAAAWRGVPSLIHEQNAVMGRANRLLAPRITAIATSFAGVADRDARLAAKTTQVGNPVRPAVIAAAKTAYGDPGAGPFRVVVFGGSQGARVMSDVVPDAVALLLPDLQARLSIVHQARPEDLARVTDSYARSGVTAEVAPFFSDLPARIAAAHLVVSRSGASTVAELTVIGRPAILVPLPHALDQDQFANAGVLDAAGGAIRLPQTAFTPPRLAAEIAGLAAVPDRLRAMADAARALGTPDAAARLAELVLGVAGVPR
jgi:UDP-N-acetylglucosamine--N-acetylmuramyl-(pentapeptide) pyrophosphoryl-undecaprenol N-acetylglucosamine transferase